MSSDPVAEYYAAVESELESLAKILNISKACASDVIYLRTRNRWTQELENDLIAKHKSGESVNIFEFGVTKETQQNLMEKVRKKLVEDGTLSPEEAAKLCGL